MKPIEKAIKHLEHFNIPDIFIDAINMALKEQAKQIKEQMKDWSKDYRGKVTNVITFEEMEIILEKVVK